MSGFFEVVAKASEITSDALKNGVGQAEKKFDPDKRIDVEKKDEPKKKNFDPDKRIGKVETEFNLLEVNEREIPNESDLVSKGKMFTDSGKRISWAQNGDGEWKGEPGISEFVPNKQNAKEALSKHGEDCIRYDSNGEPDFSKVAYETVEIDNMTEFRRGAGNNFDQADAKLAEKWNNECRNGKNDWTKSDVREWADNEENNITRHERLDKKTVDYVDSDIHEECKHFGGCAECKARDRIGGDVFDE